MDEYEIEKKHRTFYTDKNNVEGIVNYLSGHGVIYSGTLELKNGGKIKISPYEGKTEIICDGNCDEEIVNELETRVNEND